MQGSPITRSLAALEHFLVEHYPVSSRQAYQISRYVNRRFQPKRAAQRGILNKKLHQKLLPTK